MAEFKILCPACTAILSSKKPIPNGKKITCPHCHKPFVAATAEVGPAPGSSSAVEFVFSAPGPATIGAPPRNPPPAAEKPYKSAAKSSVKPGSRRLAVWTVVLGLVVLAGGGGAAVYFYVKSAADTPVAQKGKNKKADDKSEIKSVAQAPNKAKNAAARRDDKPAKAQEKEAGPKADVKTSENGKPDGNKPAAKPALAAAPAKPKAPEWKEYKSAKGGYAVEFPAKPDEHLSRDADVIHYETQADLGGAEYHVTFFRLKKDELAMPVKDRLNGIAEQFKEQTKDKKEIMLNGQPALELQMLLGDMKILAFQRWLVYKEHVFNISVSGDKERLGPDEVTRFLESFHFVAEPQGEFIDLTKASGIPEEKKKK